MVCCLATKKMILKLTWPDFPNTKNLMLKKCSLPLSYCHVSEHSLSFTCSSLIDLNVKYKKWSLMCTS